MVFERLVDMISCFFIIKVNIYLWTNRLSVVPFSIFILSEIEEVVKFLLSLDKEMKYISNENKFI